MVDPEGLPKVLSDTDTGGAGFALYVHWPFCRAKCPYCDFNSHVRTGVDQSRWAKALTAELDHMAGLTLGRTLRSIFFGGGTPSLMEPSTAAAVLDRAAARWTFANDIEITLEANPTSVEAGRFRGYAAAGVNRVSLGVQALNDADLRFLGREHSAAEAMEAVALAARLFPRYSFDLIYARPGQTVASWEAELKAALSRIGDHLSVYQLTIEAGTRFHALYSAGELLMPDEDLQGELYELTQSLLGDAGMPTYEISNHARPGGESRHNLVYWRYGDYAGIGPGAHGRLTLADGRVGTRTLRAPERWLDQVERLGHGEEPREPIPPDAQLTELLMMGLRLAEGVPLARIEAIAGKPWMQVLDRREAVRLQEAGLLDLDGERMRATVSGRQRLDAVLRRLLP
ncbi:MAG: radical SAM family heme chaperone HemW [Geminicoccaceae bacterium]